LTPDQTHIRSAARGVPYQDSACGGRLERTKPFFATAFEAMQSIGSSARIGRG
jgi:hypothetical protein